MSYNGMICTHGGSSANCPICKGILAMEEGSVHNKLDAARMASAKQKMIMRGMERIQRELQDEVDEICGMLPTNATRIRELHDVIRNAFTTLDATFILMSRKHILALLDETTHKEILGKEEGNDRPR